MSKISDDIRKRFKEYDDKRDAGLTTPEDIVRYDDIVYGEDEKWQVLDVYRPKKEGGKKLPVIVSVHGGAWVYGDKERYQYYCMSLAQRGFAVVNFTYRLAPEFQFPAPLEDTNLVFEWILKNSEQYGLDTANIFALGDSAGGACIALYTAICTNPDYAKEYNFRAPSGFVPNAIAINCGMAAMKKRLSNRQLLKLLFPGKGTRKELYLLSPINHFTSDFPPVFVMTALGDTMIKEAPVMEKRLRELNVPVIYKCYESEKEQLGHVFHVNMRLETAKICNDEQCEFFRTYMK